MISSDPTFFMNIVRVDPTVDAQLIKSAQSPEDGNIKIHSQTYQTFQMSILANQATFEYVFPNFGLSNETCEANLNCSET